MPRSRRLLCFAYGAVALLALVATWSQNLAYFAGDEAAGAGGSLAARFWLDTLATPASTSITVDLGLLLLPLLAWMVMEARRLAIRFVWVYIVIGSIVAISVTFPLFLIARERRLAAEAQAPEALGFERRDGVGLAVIGAITLGFVLYAIGR